MSRGLTARPRVLGLLRDLLELGRFHTAGFAIFLVIAGVDAARDDAPAALLATFGIVAACVNHVAFAVNDLADQDVDRLDPRRAGSPLVAGRLTRAAAFWSVIFAGGVAVVTATGTARAELVTGGATWWTAGLVLMTAVVSYQQKRWNPLVMDMLYACVFVLSLLLVWLCTSSAERLPFDWAVPIALFALALQMNLCGNLKDLETDRGTRFRTVSLEFGARITDAGQVRFGARLTGYAWMLQAMFTLGIVIAVPRTPLMLSIVVVAVGCSTVLLARLTAGRTAMHERGNAGFLWVNALTFLVLVSGRVGGSLLASAGMFAVFVAPALLLRTLRVVAQPAGEHR